MSTQSFLPVALTAAFLSLTIPPHSALSAEPLRVGMVEYQRIQRHYYRTDLERKALEERKATESEKLQASFQESRETVESLLAEQQKAQEELHDPTLSDEKKQEILAAAQKRAAEISALQRKAAQQQTAARNLLLQQAGEANVALLREINDTIRIVAEQQELDFVMNRGFGVRGVPTFPYVSAKHLVDITDEVIAKLNASAPEGWSPSPQEEE